MPTFFLYLEYFIFLLLFLSHDKLCCKHPSLFVFKHRLRHTHALHLIMDIRYNIWYPEPAKLQKKICIFVAGNKLKTFYTSDFKRKKKKLISSNSEKTVNVKAKSSFIYYFIYCIHLQFKMNMLTQTKVLNKKKVKYYMFYLLLWR